MLGDESPSIAPSRGDGHAEVEAGVLLVLLFAPDADAAFGLLFAVAVAGGVAFRRVAATRRFAPARRRAAA
jgi:hypothetical protein